MAKKAGSLAGGLAVGASKASASLFINTRGLFYRQKDFEAVLDEMQAQAREYRQLTQVLEKAPLQGDKKKELLMDSLGLASDSLLSRIFSWHIPDDLQRAYELAYPDKAAAMSLHDAAAQMDEEQLMGFTNGIKGKSIPNRPGVRPKTYGTMPSRNGHRIADIITMLKNSVLPGSGRMTWKENIFPGIMSSMPIFLKRYRLLFEKL